MAKDGRWMRYFGSRGKVVRCVNPFRYGCQRTQKLESRMLRKRARPVRRGEVRKGLSEIPPERSGGSEAQTVPRWPPTLPQRDGALKRSGSRPLFVASKGSALKRNFYHIESLANDVTEMASEAASHYIAYLRPSRCAFRGFLNCFMKGV